MNACIKTGANVYIESHNAVARGDLYLVGPMFLFVHTASPYWIWEPKPDQIADCHAQFFNKGITENRQHFFPNEPPLEHWFQAQRMIVLHSDFVQTNLESK